MRTTKCKDHYQCPYDRACLCAMDEPCLGCKNFKPERLEQDRRLYIEAGYNDGRDDAYRETAAERDDTVNWR